MTHLWVLWSYFSSSSLPGCSLLLWHLQQAILACVLDVLVTLSVLPARLLCALASFGVFRATRNWKQESVCWCYSLCPRPGRLLFSLALQHCQLHLCPPVLPELQWTGCRGVLGVRGARPEKCFIVHTQGQAMGNRLPDSHHGLRKYYFHLT